MSHRADPGFLLELQKYGAVDVAACFNCGNCSAVCPLSSETENFPRRMIRYGQLGMRDKLVRSKELWLCYNCGECTTTCPRQADPGAYMAAARRYAIGRYDRLGLARRLYTSAAFSAFFLILLAAALAIFIYSFHGAMPGDSLRLFEFIPTALVHGLGIAAGIVVAVTALSGMAHMAIQVRKASRFPEGARLNWPQALWQTIVEAVGQQRYRQDCETGPEPRPWYLRKWFIHAAMLWGFLGLFLATASDYLLALLGIKPTGTWVPIWYPVRLVGTLAGLLLVYGATLALLKRLRRDDAATAHSTPSDWAFLALLWLAGITGFALEIAVYLPQPQAWSYWMLLGHLVVVLELLILLPFGKFAHAVYRMLALYFHVLQLQPAAEVARVEAAD
jgi:ferredoxin